VGYLFGEGVREPLRIRATWVPDETINQLEDFVTSAPVSLSAVPGRVLTLSSPTLAAHSTGGVV
jgi:S-DNA-T family DNA segregation ATPase FtsK/SpoIIIE